MMKLTALKIDPEFQGKIPPLTSEELDQLEKEHRQRWQGYQPHHRVEWTDY